MCLGNAGQMFAKAATQVAEGFASNPAASIGTALTTGLTIGSRVVEASATNARAKAVSKQIQADTANTQAELTAQQAQTNAAAAQDSFDVIRKARIARAQARLRAGAAGLSTNLQNRFAQEQNFTAGQDLSRIEANRKNAVKQTQRSKKSASISAQRRLAGLDRASAFGTALQSGLALAEGAVTIGKNAPVKGKTGSK